MLTRVYVRLALSVVGVCVLIFIAAKLSLLLAPFAVSYILYFVLKPFVNMLEERNLKHIYSVIIVFTVAFGLITLVFILLVPAIASEISSIQDKLDDYIGVFTEILSKSKSSLSSFSNGLSFLFSESDSISNEIETNVKSTILSFVRKIPSMLFTFLPLVLYTTVIPFATFFFLLDDTKIKKRVISLIPNRYFETSLLLFHSLNQQFGWLLMGMFISVIIISILSSFGLWIIGLEYPIIVGIFAGVSNLIPYVGPVVGTLVACFVAVMTSMPLYYFVKIILVFLAVNLIDNVFVQPLVMSRAANLHPLFVIILVLFGSKFGGVLGMLVAVPLASLLQVIFKILLDEFKRPIKPDFLKYKVITVDCKEKP
ncbi:AI-2E family transporter [bacterium]|nr:AI-2E family transporter [bacterium]